MDYLGLRIWFFVAIGGWLVFLELGIRSTFGIFLVPMSIDLGWGRAVFALAIAIQNFVWGLGQPLAGMVADRFGKGRVLAFGGLSSMALPIRFLRVRRCLRSGPSV